MGGEFITAEEFAARYKVSVETVRRWWRRGVLPGAIKMPRGTIRIDVAQFDAAVRRPVEA